MNRFADHAVLFLMLFSILMGGCQRKGDPDTSPSEVDLIANKKTAIAVTHASATGLGELLRSIPDSTSKVRLIQIYIDSIRFYDDRSGYFYVYNYQCTNIAHATQNNLVGCNLNVYKDSRGKFVIRALSARARAGGGFVEYYWIKPGEIGEKLKIGYVEAIPGTNFFIGTGVYLTQ